MQAVPEVSIENHYLEARECLSHKLFSLKVEQN